jgi:hypothetical protein
MKEIFKKIISSFLNLLAMALSWQGMNEIYKFDDADYGQAIYLLLIAFYTIFLSKNVDKWDI